MEMEEVVLDYPFNFTKDRSVIRTRIFNILTALGDNIRMFSNYVKIQNVFQIIADSKPVWPAIQQLSPTFREAIERSTEDFKRISISDLAYFERKMLLVSLTTIFEVFTEDVLLLGAFYHPDKVFELFPEDKDRKKLQSLLDEKEVYGFGEMVAKKVTFKKRAGQIKNAYKIIHGADLFPDSKTEDALLDLIEVRNNIVHRNGILKESDIANIKYKGVVKRHSMAEFCKITGKSLDSVMMPNFVTFSLNLLDPGFNQIVLDGMDSFINHIKSAILSQF